MIELVLLCLFLRHLVRSFAHAHPDAFVVLMFSALIVTVLFAFYPELRRPKRLIRRYAKRATSR